jgi:hypothetical protein
LLGARNARLVNHPDKQAGIRIPRGGDEHGTVPLQRQPAPEVRADGSINTMPVAHE